MNEDKLIIKPKRPKGEDGYKVFSIRIKEEMVEQLDQVASLTGRSRNELIGMFLEYAIGRSNVDVYMATPDSQIPPEISSFPTSTRKTSDEVSATTPWD